MKLFLRDGRLCMCE